MKKYIKSSWFDDDYTEYDMGRDELICKEIAKLISKHYHVNVYSNGSDSSTQWGQGLIDFYVNIEPEGSLRFSVDFESYIDMLHNVKSDRDMAEYLVDWDEIDEEVKEQIANGDIKVL